MIRLSTRDKKALSIGAAAVFFFLVLQVVLFPLLEKRKKLERALTTQREAVQTMGEMQGRLRELQTHSSSLRRQLEARAADFSLFSFIEQVAGRTGLKDHIVYMKPSASSGEEGELQQVLVEMKLQAISLQQLVDLFKELESPENVVALQRASIEMNSRGETALDVILQIVSVAADPARQQAQQDGAGSQ